MNGISVANSIAWTVIVSVVGTACAAAVGVALLANGGIVFGPQNITMADFLPSQGGAPLYLLNLGAPLWQFAGILVALIVALAIRSTPSLAIRVTDREPPF